MPQPDLNRLNSEIQRLQRNADQRPKGRSFRLGVRWNDTHTDVDFLYRPDQLLCEAQDLAEVLGAFKSLGQDDPGQIDDGPVELKVLNVGTRDAADLADELAEVIDDDIVTPNHILDVKGTSVFCPATEPVPWRAPVQDLHEPVGPGRPRLAVVDTGYLPSIATDSGYTRFAAVDPDSELDNEVYSDGTAILPYGGHGTAATARLLSVSGQGSVRVHVRDSLVGGAVDELTIVDDLQRAVRDGADVISVQAGMYTRAGRSPKAFNAFHRRLLRRRPETVLIVAAGNDGSDRPFWPAAYDWTTAVGALTYGGGSRTGWTNHGHWVDVYASGENVVVPFPNGVYEYLDGFTSEFTTGHAIWSGTSFASPVVSGMIARRMVERGVDAPTARDIVLAEAEVASLPNTGPRVLV